MVVLGIVRVDESLAITVAVKVCAGRTPTGLHGQPGLEARNAICRHPFVVKLGIDHVPSIGVVSGQVEEVHAGEDDKESAQQRDGVDRIRGVEPLKENKRGAKCGGRERDIVEGVHTEPLLALGCHCFRGRVHVHRGRERVQRFVEVVHLGENAEACHDGKHIGGCVNKLVVALKREFHSNAKGLDRHNRDRANGGADGDVDERVLLSVQRSNSIDHHCGEACHGQTVQKEGCAKVSSKQKDQAHVLDVRAFTAYPKSVSIRSTGLSGGAWRTMTTDPRRHIAQPNFPNIPNRSLRKYEPRTALYYC